MLSANRGVQALAIGLLLALPLVFFWRMVVSGEEPLAPDTQAVRPLGVWAESAREELGAPPLWCPMIFAGMPSYGSFIHTPSSPLDLTRWLRAPFAQARGARYYTAMVIGAVALYVLLRRRGCHPLSAFGGGFIFVMTPYVLGMVAAGHSTKLQTFYLIPLVFLAIEWFVARPAPATAAGVAAAVALQLWNHHPQISYYTLLLGGLYALLVVLTRRPPQWQGRRLLSAGLLAALALTLAAGLVLEPYATVLEYAPHSIRGDPGVLEEAAGGGGGASWDYATAWSYPPEEVLAFVFPGWFGLEGATYWGRLPFTQSTHYFGVMALFLAFLGLALTTGPRRWVSAALIGVVLLVGFGRHLPLFFWPLYKFMPMFSRFRVPSMIYALLPFFVALLAADGLGAVLRGGWATARRAPQTGRERKVEKEGRQAKESRRAAAPAPEAGEDPARGVLRRWGVVVIVLLALLVLWLIAANGVTEAMRRAGAFAKAGEAERYGEHFGWLVGQRIVILRQSVTVALLLLAAGALVLEGRRRGRLSGGAAAGLLVALLVVDLWVADRKFYAPRPRSQTEAVLVEDAVVRALRDRPRPFRVAPLAPGEFQTNRYAAFGIESVGGYQPAKLRAYDDLIRSGAIYTLPVLSMLNARYLITDRALPESEFPLLARVADAAGAVQHIHENPRALPRAWFVREVRAAADAQALLATMLQPDFDAARTAWLLPGDAAAFGDSLSAGAVLSASSDADHLRLRVRVAGPADGLLVLSEVAYPPGWRARVDERPAAILTANHLLRAVRVPAGEHTIDLEAVSRGLRAGRALSRVSAAAVLMLLGSALLPRLRRRPGAVAGYQQTP